MVVWGLLGFMVAGILGLVGAGGGIVAVPLFMSIGGYDIHTASILSLGVVGSAALLTWAPRRDLTHFKAVLPILAGALPMIYITIPLKARTLPITLAIILNCVALFSLYNLWFNDKPPAKEDDSRDHMNRKEVLKVFVLGGLVGFLTTMVGVGGGIFLIIGLRYYFRLSTERSISTSLLASVFIATAALFGQDRGLGGALKEIAYSSLIALFISAAITSFTVNSFLDKLPEDLLKSLRKWAMTVMILATMATTIEKIWIPPTAL